MHLSAEKVLKIKPSSRLENRLRGERGTFTNFPGGHLRFTLRPLRIPKLQPRNGDGYARFERLLRRQRDSSANEVIIASLGKRAIVACRAQATAERSQATSP